MFQVPAFGTTVFLFGSVIVQSPGNSCGLHKKHSGTGAGSLARSHHSTSARSPPLSSTVGLTCHNSNLQRLRCFVLTVVGQAGAGFISRISGGHQEPRSNGGLPYNVWLQTAEAQRSQHGLLVPDGRIHVASAIRTGWAVLTRGRNMYIIQNHCVSALCPLCGIQKSRKRVVSESGSVSILMWGEGDTYSVGSLRKS
jgi:hypothetical protein